MIISNETNKEKIDSQIKTMIRNLEEERKKEILYRQFLMATVFIMEKKSWIFKNSKRSR